MVLVVIACFYWCFPEQDSTQTGIIVTVVFVLVLVILTPVMVYALMYRCKGIKQWLRGPRYQIPDDVSTKHTHTGHVT